MERSRPQRPPPHGGARWAVAQRAVRAEGCPSPPRVRDGTLQAPSRGSAAGLSHSERGGGEEEA